MGSSAEAIATVLLCRWLGQIQHRHGPGLSWVPGAGAWMSLHALPCWSVGVAAPLGCLLAPQQQCSVHMQVMVLLLSLGISRWRSSRLCRLSDHSELSCRWLPSVWPHGSLIWSCLEVTAMISHTITHFFPGYWLLKRTHYIHAVCCPHHPPCVCHGDCQNEHSIFPFKVLSWLDFWALVTWAGVTHGDL